MDNFNTTVLIPVHKYNDDVKALLDKALKSVENQTLSPKATAVVCPQEIADVIKENHNVDVIVNGGDTDFCSQINVGAEAIETDYFTILEFDDEFTRNAILHVEKYCKSRNFSNSNIILPLVSLIKDGRELMIANGAAWAQEFTSKLGYLDLKSVSENDIFIISGATINKATYQEIGGLKSNIKLLFTKEFLMRAIHMNSVVSILPKISMLHTIGREDSLFENYKSEGLGSDEIAYIEKAIKKGEYKNKVSNFTPYSSNTEG